jgi:hypothetical protein
MKHVLFLAIIGVLTISGCGRQGPVGAVGSMGPTGEQGLPGLDAVNCVVTSVGISAAAPNGGSLLTCPTSSQLILNGTNGVNGTTGAAGSNGSNGSNGTAGTVISMVKLCPGTTVYPSKFIEVAACINNELVGVYSQNGGFLTELPAGTYGSNGINASCNFVIGSNCSVSN